MCEREGERETDRQTDRHTDRQTYRQTDRQTDRVFSKQNLFSYIELVSQKAVLKSIFTDIKITITTIQNKCWLLLHVETKCA